MLPEARYVWVWCITVIGKVIIEADGGNKARQKDFVHPVSNLHVCVAIV